MNPFCLFILKRQHDYGGCATSNSLYIASKMIVDMLQLNGHPAAIEEAEDQNCVHRFVLKYKPSVVVIEALWVTPRKFVELQKLSPQVKWVVRINSETPFLAVEGIAVDWITDYLAQGITVAFNSKVTLNDFSLFTGPTVWLPNYYPPLPAQVPNPPNNPLAIGCFGAIRQMKNQLIQAIAAVKFGAEWGKHIRFYMNSGRVEGGSEGILRNIQALMDETGNELIVLPWLSHAEFLETVAHMDIGLQVSLSESFNMIAADFVSVGVPLIGSPAVRWLPAISQANPSSSYAIKMAMNQDLPTVVSANHEALVDYDSLSVNAWNSFLGW
jgi:hypothetical protein